MADGQAVQFDPFLAAPMMGATSRWPSRRFLLLVPAVAVAAIAVAWAEGTLGTPKDFQLWADFKRASGVGTAAPSPPRFPLLRDYPSWCLATLIALTCALVHRQWRTMRDCLSLLRHNEVLRPRDRPALSRIHRVLQVERTARSTSNDGLRALVDRINDRVFRTLGPLNVIVAFASVLLVALLVLGQNRSGIFEAVAPPGQAASARQAWLSDTYASWWAGTSHVGGVLVYSAIATLGVYVILLQNVVGIVCVYLCIAIPALDEPDIDWVNDDGRYGWRPLATVYQTVNWSVVLHGLGLSLLLFVLGVENFRWVLVLWALWVTILPLYMVVPRLVFRRVVKEARRKRLAVLEQTLVTARSHQDPTRRMEVEAFVAEHRRAVETARIRPLRMRRFELGPVVIGALFPIALAVAQTVFSLTFGSQR
jgi:hypothetical protein